MFDEIEGLEDLPVIEYTEDRLQQAINNLLDNIDREEFEDLTIVLTELNKLKEKL